jgi:hypothetical protein
MGTALPGPEGPTGWQGVHVTQGVLLWQLGLLYCVTQNNLHSRAQLEQVERISTAA